MPCYDGREGAIKHCMPLLLCKACSLLSKDQLINANIIFPENIDQDAIEDWGNLFKWYKSHLYFDYHMALAIKNDQDKHRIETEANRLGFAFCLDKNGKIEMEQI